MRQELRQRGPRAGHRVTHDDTRAPLGLFLCPWLLAALVYPQCTRGDFFSQIFIPSCRPIREPPPPPGYLLWSNAATWSKFRWGRPPSLPLFPPVIPGVGTRGMGLNVTIPCGVAVLLDVPALVLTHLDIRGLLRVEDSVAGERPRVYRVRAAYVSVEGQLLIGTSAQHFRSRITFTLTPNPRNRLPLEVAGLAYPDKARRVGAVPTIANVGHKAFAVVGGGVQLYGMPGGRDTPAWMRLSATAYEGQTWIRVKGDVVGRWPPGGRIAVASTDFSYDHAEDFIILSVIGGGKGTSIIRLNRPLKWRHVGVLLSDGMGGVVDERAEVALLSRNIVITGVPEGGQYLREGGHFIVFQTATPQVLEGVEFWRLGQQGTLGRYNIHFHVCGDDGGRSTVYKNSIHDSNQRCVVVHATHNLTVHSTVAYNTSGHCFMVEEGGEQDNTFLGNLGILTLPVSTLAGPTETDKAPATFWISNIGNSFLGNIAAGSYSAGFWTELRTRVRGMSLFIPELQGIQPIYSPGATFDGNVMHSNWEFGFRAYPHGIRAQGTGYYSGQGDLAKTQAPYTITRLVAYKHRRMGVFLQASGAVVISRSTFADNSQGVIIQGDNRGLVVSSRFVGVTANVGTPPSLYLCGREYGPLICGPVQGCQFPPTDPGNTRAMGKLSWQEPIFGILISGINFLVQTSPMAQMRNNQFSLYDSTCRPAAGVGVSMQLGGDWWDAAVAIQGASVGPGSTPVWLPPPVFVDPVTGQKWAASEALTRDLALRDTRGAIVGGKGGYVLANDSFLLPPGAGRCRPMPASNAYACPGVCYRTVVIQYSEDGFVPYPAGGDWTPKRDGDYSFLQLTRDADKAERTAHGNLNASAGDGGQTGKRVFFLSLQAGQVYTVAIKPGRKSPRDFGLGEVLVYFADGWGKDRPCPGMVNLRFLPRGQSSQWEVASETGAFFSPCPGVTFSGRSRPWPVMFIYACNGASRALLLRLNPSLPPRTNVVLTPTAGRVTLCRGTTVKCAVVAPLDWYDFNDSGRDLHESSTRGLGFQSPGFRDLKGWKSGRSIIGFYQYFGPKLATKSFPSGDPGGTGVPRTTFYFRRYFTVAQAACYTSMVVYYYPIDGIVAYLNGAEAFRFGMAEGPVTGSTFATNGSAYNAYASLVSSPPIPIVASPRISSTLPRLLQGQNLLAYEVHAHSPRDYNWYFDAAVALNYRC